MPYKKYIIYAPSYDENSGGSIALHHLCHLLNKSGQEALLWHRKKALINKDSAIKFIESATRLAKYSLLRRTLVTNPDFNTPLATIRDLENAIVIYPEVTSGNPLNGNSIVRWFLNKPGRITGHINYGANELYFFYNKHFNDESLNPNQSHFLKTIYVKDSIYYNQNLTSRSGTCHVVRKGSNKNFVHNLKKSISIEHLSHIEIANVFNRTKYFISYDSYTMLSKYAAMCGCISVVIPDKGVSKEEWRPDIQNRYGIAYGFNDIQWAITTQNRVLENFQDQIRETEGQLQRFITTTQQFFR